MSHQSDWWAQDEEPYPGPDLVTIEAFREVFVAIGRGWGKALRQLGESKAFKTLCEASGLTLVQMHPVLGKPIKPNLNKNGPFYDPHARHGRGQRR